MNSPFNKNFNSKSPVKVAISNRERRKAEKAGKAFAQSMEVGISDRKRKRKTEKSNKKIMKALERDTYANKSPQGHARFSHLSKRDRKILDVSAESSKKNRTKYVDTEYKLENSRLSDYPLNQKQILHPIDLEPRRKILPEIIRR